MADSSIGKLSRSKTQRTSTASTDGEPGTSASATTATSWSSRRAKDSLKIDIKAAVDGLIGK
jgi:hypothetical protein